MVYVGILYMCYRSCFSGEGKVKVCGGVGYGRWYVWVGFNGFLSSSCD